MVLLSEGSVDLDQNETTKYPLLRRQETNPTNDTTIATTVKIDDMIDAAKASDIASTDGVSDSTNDGDGTITIGLSDNAVDLDKIKTTIRLLMLSRMLGHQHLPDTNIFTASAAASTI